MCNEERERHFDLLYLKQTIATDRRDLSASYEEKGHYVYIKSMSRLLGSQVNKHMGHMVFCRRCLSHFQGTLTQSAEEQLEAHRLFCGEHKPVRVELPVNKPYIEFEQFKKTLALPYVIYADFESILTPVETENDNAPSQSKPYTAPYQNHLPMSFGVKVQPSASVAHIPLGHGDAPYEYTGPDAPKKFMEYLGEVAEDIQNIYKRNEPIHMTDEDNVNFSASTICYLCTKPFTLQNPKVRDHCHITSKFLGAAHRTCNVDRRTPTFIPVFIHNLSGYDSHFLIRELGEGGSGRVNVIPQSTEKYISFSKTINGITLRFVDSFKFMSQSLEKLVGCMSEDSFTELERYYGQDVNLMRRKGVYPYDYVDSWEKLDEPSLPPREAFFNQLTQKGCTEEDYAHAQKVWETLGCTTFKEYSEHYLRTDVLLLCDVFEAFRKVTLEKHGLDPAWYYTAPGLTWDAMLKYTDVKLDLLTDYDMILMLERGIRGGTCCVTHKYAEANNKYMSSYDPLKPSKHIVYLDANNLYGDAMSRPLPFRGFEWVSNPEQIDLASLNEDDQNGYIFEVDVEYPEHLHDLHSDFPFLPETIVPPGSPYKIPKLIPHLGKREHYVAHYMALKQAAEAGLLITRVHRALKFEQSRWLEPYISFNTNLRKEARNDFEKDQFKLYNNACFGKTMENVRKRIDIRFALNAKQAMRLASKPNFVDRTIYSENCVAFHMERTKVLFDKPIYIGMSVLDISKTIMYRFHYDVMLARYGRDKLKLLYSDTDSLIYSVETEDIYADMRQMGEHFDMSEYPPTHPNFSLVNKKKLGKFKDEVHGKIITRFVGLRPKLYAFIVDGHTKKRAKGVVRSAIEELRFNQYVDCLRSGEKVLKNMRSIRSKDHNVKSILQNKVALSSHDDKRVPLEDGETTLPYWHKDLE